MQIRLSLFWPCSAGRPQGPPRRREMGETFGPPGAAAPTGEGGTDGRCLPCGAIHASFSVKKSRLLKAAVMKRQAALPVVSHSIWALFLVFSSMPFTR